MALIDYAWASMGNQHVDLQKDALRKVDCERVFEGIISGTKKKRQGLNAVPTCLRKDDALVVWKLDRLGCLTVHLVNTVQGLTARGVDLKVLTG